MPFVHDTREDDDLAKERYLIEATFKRLAMVGAQLHSMLKSNFP